MKIDNIKILVIDNYDSFVYNLVHMLYEIGVAQVDIVKNDLVDLDMIAAYDKILLSPGPGVPKDAGLMPQIIDKYAGTKSILGVCLGHQAIVEQFGGENKLTELISKLAGYMGEAAGAGMVVGMSPMIIMAGAAKGVYKKITD